MAKIVVLEPVAEPRPVIRELAPRPDTLAGKRVGFLSNTRPNVGELLQAIERRLRERFDSARFVHRGKPIARGAGGGRAARRARARV